MSDTGWLRWWCFKAKVDSENERKHTQKEKDAHTHASGTMDGLGDEPVSRCQVIALSRSPTYLPIPLVAFPHHIHTGGYSNASNQKRNIASCWFRKSAWWIIWSNELNRSILPAVDSTKHWKIPVRIMRREQREKERERERAQKRDGAATPECPEWTQRIPVTRARARERMMRACRLRLSPAPSAHRPQSQRHLHGWVDIIRKATIVITFTNWLG